MTFASLEAPPWFLSAVVGRWSADVEEVSLQGAGDAKRHIFAGVLYLTEAHIATATVYKGAAGSAAAEKTSRVIRNLGSYESECSNICCRYRGFCHLSLEVLYYQFYDTK